jgi:hypothetical protein
MRILLLCLGLVCSAFSARAGNDLNMKAVLIWGCDDEKPNDPSLKPVNADMEKRLKGIFKWKHYFMVTNMTAKIPEKGSHKFVLSKKCEVDVANKKESYEAKLFGETKLLKKVDQPVKMGEEVVLAGDDKNSTAWFVVLSPQPMPQK